MTDMHSTQLDDTRKKRRKLQRQLPTTLFIIGFLAWPILHWFVFNGFVNFSTLYNSFFVRIYAGAEEHGFTFYNYIKVFKLLFDTNSTENYPLGFLNALTYLGFNNLILLPLSLVIAFVLSRKMFMGKFFQAVYFFPSLISIVAMATAWREMWTLDYGVFGNIMSWFGVKPAGGYFSGSFAQPMILLYCLWTGIGWNNLILSGAINQVPVELYEAAELDGANGAQQLWHVTLPCIWPTINTLVVMGTAGAFTVFLQAQMLAPSEGITIAMIVVNKVDSLDYGLASATGIFIGIFGMAVVYGIRRLLSALDKKMGY
ncbi:MAG: sugar ABC transporter permease [Clostridia bacterium]|nr:sugar ABC transporter permease [Clostridia bacterium]MBQ7913878.1 sugar ABC transporter permease [Clostridia bacterium]